MGGWRQDSAVSAGQQETQSPARCQNCLEGEEEMKRKNMLMLKTVNESKQSLIIHLVCEARDLAILIE